MLNYIRGELYKVFHRKYIWITLAVVLVLEGLLASGHLLLVINGNTVSPNGRPFVFGITFLILMLSVGFYATLITCDMVFANQYKHSTLKNEVSFGLSRSRIYIGKLIAQTILSTLFFVVMIGFYLALCWLTQSHDPEMDAEIMGSLGYCLAVMLPLWIGVQAMTCAMYFLVKNDNAALFASIGILAVLPNAIWIAASIIYRYAPSLSDTLMTIYRYMPTVMGSEAQDMGMEWAYCGKAWQVGAVWLFGFTAIGLQIFHRKELK